MVRRIVLFALLPACLEPRKAEEQLQAAVATAQAADAKAETVAATDTAAVVDTAPDPGPVPDADPDPGTGADSGPHPDIGPDPDTEPDTEPDAEPDTDSDTDPDAGPGPDAPDGGTAPTGCQGDDDCKAVPGKPYCKANVCVQCLDPDQCGGGACVAGACLGGGFCDKTADCAGNPKYPVCDVANATCMPCKADGDCGSGATCKAGACQKAPAVCGNKFVESGETCDDGGSKDGDGCSAACLSETPPLGGLIDAAMAFDPASGVGWIVGGELGYQLNEAVIRYAEDGKGGPAFAPYAVTGPPARARASLVRDPKTGHLYLFGGEGYWAVFNDVWRLVPAATGAPAWQELKPANAPPTERMHAIAFWHAGSSRMVVGLGEGYYQLPEDWWAFNPATKVWKPLTAPANGPKPRKAPAVVADGTGGAWVYGGQGYWDLYADLWHLTLTGDAIQAKELPLLPAPPLPLLRGCLTQTAKGLLLAGGETFYRLNDEAFAIDPASGKWTAGKGPQSAGPVCHLRADGQVVVQLGQGYWQWTQAPTVVAP